MSKQAESTECTACWPSSTPRPRSRGHVVASPSPYCAGLPGRITASSYNVAMPQRRIANTVSLAPTQCAAHAMPAPLRALLRTSQRIAARKRPYRGRVRAVSWALLRAVSQDTLMSLKVIYFQSIFIIDFLSKKNCFLCRNME